MMLQIMKIFKFSPESGGYRYHGGCGVRVCVEPMLGLGTCLLVSLHLIPVAFGIPWPVSIWKTGSVHVLY